jgi:hypothetical protein
MLREVRREACDYCLVLDVDRVDWELLIPSLLRLFERGDAARHAAIACNHWGAYADRENLKTTEVDVEGDLVIRKRGSPRRVGAAFGGATLYRGLPPIEWFGSWAEFQRGTEVVLHPDFVVDFTPEVGEKVSVW